MPDSDFPSGPWTGYYQYHCGTRSHQGLRLVFADGRMTGSGADEVGPFSVDGNYSVRTKEAEWVKTYHCGHRVEYRGFREGPIEGIWGIWTISADWCGGFHIWPLAAHDEVNVQDTAADEALRNDPLIREAIKVFKRRIEGVS